MEEVWGGKASTAVSVRLLVMSYLLLSELVGVERLLVWGNVTGPARGCHGRSGVRITEGAHRRIVLFRVISQQFGVVCFRSRGLQRPEDRVRGSSASSTLCQIHLLLSSPRGQESIEVRDPQKWPCLYTLVPESKRWDQKGSEGGPTPIL